MKYLLLVLSVLLVGCTPKEEAAFELASVEISDDATVSNPANYHLLDANESVRIIHVVYEPGQMSTLHAHPDLAFVSVDDLHYTFTTADGTESVVETPAGTAGYSPADAHTVLNSGEATSQVILVELLDPPEMDAEGADAMPDEDWSGIDATIADAERHTVELENERVRVIRYNYAAGATSNRHSHPAGVLIPLVSGSAILIADDGTETEVEIQAGQPFWSAAGVHVATNTSDVALEGFLVEIKH